MRTEAKASVRTLISFIGVANFDSEVPALNRRELGANPRRPTISASVVKLQSCSASNGEFAGGSPAGCTNSCRVSPTTRGAPLRTERLGVELPHAAPFWNVHRSSAPGLFAKQCVPSGKWCESTAFRHSCARSSKRAGGFIPRIALDECRDPERYQTRAPFSAPLNAK